jgi:hypothetical protein
MTPAEGQAESAIKRSIYRKILTRLEASMKTKKFCITFEFDERTHWLFNSADQAIDLQAVAENVATCHTTGARPKVTVLVLQSTRKPRS